MNDLRDREKRKEEELWRQKLGGARNRPSFLIFTRMCHCPVRMQEVSGSTRIRIEGCERYAAPSVQENICSPKTVWEADRMILSPRAVTQSRALFRAIQTA